MSGAAGDGDCHGGFGRRSILLSGYLDRVHLDVYAAPREYYRERNGYCLLLLAVPECPDKVAGRLTGSQSCPWFIQWVSPFRRILRMLNRDLLKGLHGIGSSIIYIK